MTYYRDDEYDRPQQNVIPFPKMVREPCGLCTDGRVPLGDGTTYALCAYCRDGSIIVEQR